MTSFARALLRAAPLALVVASAAPIATASAQQQPPGNSLPQPVTVPDTIPAPKDVPYSRREREKFWRSHRGQALYYWCMASKLEC